MKKYKCGEPRVEVYDYLDHNFIYADKYNIRIYNCSKCNMEAFIKIENDILEEIRFPSNNLYRLYYSYESEGKYISNGECMTCEEYIIKNIIE